MKQMLMPRRDSEYEPRRHMRSVGAVDRSNLDVEFI